MIRRLGILVWRGLRRARVSASAYASYGLSYVRARRQIISVASGTDGALGASVALFVHFDRHGRVADHTLNYITSLGAAGFSVVFVTNSGRLDPTAAEALRDLCAAVIIRRNVGYDFGAMADALSAMALPRPDTQRLLIANDSVYGPLTPIRDIVARMDFAQADVWGATDSWQHRYHLQSYFLLAGRRALDHPAWAAFWNQVRQVSSKDWVISRYEVGLTQALLRGGLRCRALWRYQNLLDQAIAELTAAEQEGGGRTLIERARMERLARVCAAYVKRAPVNPTAELWRELLADGYPFIKAELLRTNPARVPDVAEWQAVVERFSIADTGLVERDLQQKLRHSAP